MDDPVRFMVEVERYAGKWWANLYTGDGRLLATGIGVMSALSAADVAIHKAAEQEFAHLPKERSD